ncbi:MAG: hypothetical protein HYY48_10795 [Gammaproteobacteria bacterium]|nr:hypothetical protein [Gammaproteobacteria bacterium]
MPEKHFPVAFPARKAKGAVFALHHFSVAAATEKCHDIHAMGSCRFLPRMATQTAQAASN